MVGHMSRPTPIGQAQSGAAPDRGLHLGRAQRWACASGRGDDRRGLPRVVLVARRTLCAPPRCLGWVAATARPDHSCRAFRGVACCSGGVQRLAEVSFRLLGQRREARARLPLCRAKAKRVNGKSLNVLQTFFVFRVTVILFVFQSSSITLRSFNSHGMTSIATNLEHVFE